MMCCRGVTNGPARSMEGKCMLGKRCIRVTSWWAVVPSAMKLNRYLRWKDMLATR